MFDTFTKQYQRYTTQLDNPARPMEHNLEARTFRLYERHQKRPEAWLLYNRVVALQDGDIGLTDRLIASAPAMLGEHFTPDMRIQLECDRVIGAARVAKRTYQLGIALSATERFSEMRLDLLGTVDNDPNWSAYTMYVNARGSEAAHIELMSHLAFMMARDTWHRMEEGVHEQRLTRNLVFLLHAAIVHGDANEIELVAQQLRELSPNDWERYGTRLTQPGGLKWFDGLDIRW